MATVKRLIDANALIEDLEAAEANGGMGAVVSRTLIRYVKRCATVDAVEVVRCKDCKYFLRNTKVDTDRGDCCCYGIVAPRVKKIDDFCSYGERRSDD